MIDGFVAQGGLETDERVAASLERSGRELLRLRLDERRLGDEWLARAHQSRAQLVQRMHERARVRERLQLVDRHDAVAPVTPVGVRRVVDQLRLEPLGAPTPGRENMRVHT